MNLLRVELAIDRRRVDRHVRLRGLDRRDALGRRDDTQQPDVARAGLLQHAIAASALPPVASIGSTMSAVLPASPAGAWRNTARRALCVRRAAGRCGRRARAAAARARPRPCPVPRAAPAPRRRRRRAPRPASFERRFHRASVIGSLRVASIATTRLSRCVSRRKWLGRSPCRAATSGHPARSDGGRDERARENYTGRPATAGAIESWPMRAMDSSGRPWCWPRWRRCWPLACARRPGRADQPAGDRRHGRDDGRQRRP